MSKAITTGSLSQISQQVNQSLAESFMSVDVLLIVDMSGSMTMRDARDGQARHKVAESELRRLQAEMPGKIGVVSFSDKVEFCPSGIPTPFFESTNMANALRFVKPADSTGIRFILISDGLPNSESETLTIAQTFETKIDTIYIGPESGFDASGREFLERLAAATGGQHVKAREIAQLAEPVKYLLEGGR
jgi:Mg-chelatase subunit ChlD